MKDEIKNMSASVRARLVNIARAEKRDFQEVLTRFALERLLYRITLAPHAELFTLKGALLFVLWSENIHRYTQDMDLLGKGEPSPEHLTGIFQDICRVAVPDDGLIFAPESVKASYIREEKIYGGIRIKMLGLLERARIPIQVDIGYGDAVVPEAQEQFFPTLLDFPAPRLRAYARETSISEKFMAMVTLELENSRMKDYFDIWLLSRDFAFDGETLKGAIAATFTRRREPLPGGVPVGLTETFSTDATRREIWGAFVRQRVVTPEALPSFEEVVKQISGFLLPALEAARAGQEFAAHWEPGGPWITEEARQ
jgi:hypothetical protein